MKRWLEMKKAKEAAQDAETSGEAAATSATAAAPETVDEHGRRCGRGRHGRCGGWKRFIAAQQPESGEESTCERRRHRFRGHFPFGGPFSHWPWGMGPVMPYGHPAWHRPDFDGFTSDSESSEEEPTVTSTTAAPESRRNRE